VVFYGVLFGMFFQIKAQSDVNNNTQKYVASISSDMMNVLYIGIDNPISIAVSNISMDDLIVEMTNGNIRKIGNNYLARAFQKGESKISVFIKKKGEKIHLGSMVFRVEYMPKPEVSWGKLYDGDSVSLTQIQENNFQFFASHRWIGCLEGVKYKIQSFEFSILSKDFKIMKTINVEGNKLNEEALDILKEITTENSIMIDRVLAIGPGGEKYLQSIIIHIR